MKTLLLFLFCGWLGTASVAQKNNWFTPYTDSVALVADARQITAAFIADIKQINPDIRFNVETRLYTTPYLIYFDTRKVNISLLSQVDSKIQAWTNSVSGGEEDGKKVFGLFFNGFYLPHELGHALQDIVEGNLVGSYQNEHFANIVAMLWWRKQGRQKELEQCYAYAKKIIAQLANPVPEGKTMDAFFTENYRKATQNPSVYGYMQMTQFIEIYDDKTHGDFDGFIKSYQQKAKK